MFQRIYSLMVPALACSMGLSGCIFDGQDPVPGTPTTTLTLSRVDSGDLEYCDAATGECMELPYEGDCAVVQIELDNSTGKACERCLDEAGTVTAEGCGDASIACVVVTLPDPDCVVCAYVNGAVLHSTCAPEEPEECVAYWREDGTACEECYDPAGKAIYNSCGPNCAAVGCPDVACAPGFELTQIPGECCGQCLPVDDCDQVICAMDVPVTDCPPGTILVRDPANCCDHICEPIGCPPPPLPDGSTADGDAPVCGTDEACPDAGRCVEGVCIFEGEDPRCPPGFVWDPSFPSCGRCLPLPPPPTELCVTAADCPVDMYCAFDQGNCAGTATNTDPASGEDYTECLGVCRPIEPVCDPSVPPGGATEPNAYCEGVWDIQLDAAGCMVPVCICPDGVATADGLCFNQCMNVDCFAPPLPCEPGFHHEFEYPYCCGICVPDDVCATYGGEPGGTDPTGGDPDAGQAPGVWTCPEVLCAPGFVPVLGQDCCPTCEPDFSMPRACASDAECQAGEYCTVRDQVCNEPPGCLEDPALCDGPCYGECYPAMSDCYESDAGIDPLFRGETVEHSADGTGNPIIREDTCSADGLSVVEVYCANNVGGRAAQDTVIECPNGCRDGACID